MVTAKREDREITRYSSHFKSVLNPPDLPGTDKNEDIHIKEKQDDAVAQGTNSQNNAATDMPRRSTRNRRPPTYLKDYVRE